MLAKILLLPRDKKTIQLVDQEIHLNYHQSLKAGIGEIVHIC